MLSFHRPWRRPTGPDADQRAALLRLIAEGWHPQKFLDLRQRLYEAIVAHPEPLLSALAASPAAFSLDEPALTAFCVQEMDCLRALHGRFAAVNAAVAPCAQILSRSDSDPTLTQTPFEGERTESSDRSGRMGRRLAAARQLQEDLDRIAFQGVQEVRRLALNGPETIFAVQISAPANPPHQAFLGLRRLAIGSTHNGTALDVLILRLDDVFLPQAVRLIYPTVLCMPFAALEEVPLLIILLEDLLKPFQEDPFALPAMMKNIRNFLKDRRLSETSLRLPAPMPLPSPPALKNCVYENYLAGLFSRLSLYLLRLSQPGGNVPNLPLILPRRHCIPFRYDRIVGSRVTEVHQQAQAVMRQIALFDRETLASQEFCERLTLSSGSPALSCHT